MHVHACCTQCTHTCGDRLAFQQALTLCLLYQCLLCEPVLAFRWLAKEGVRRQWLAASSLQPRVSSDEPADQQTPKRKHLLKLVQDATLSLQCPLDQSAVHADLGVQGFQGCGKASLPKARRGVLIGPQHVWVGEEQLHAAPWRGAAVQRAACQHPQRSARACSADVLAAVAALI